MAEREARRTHTDVPQKGAAASSPREREPSAADDIAAELVAAKDRLLRSLAEQENMRGQAQRDRAEAVKYAVTGFAGDLLSSVDNLERALVSVPEDKRAEPAVAGLLTGVEATRRALLDTFAKHGLQRIDPLGEPFDPHRHEASLELEDARHPPGTVMSVIQPGYMHHDRLVRPALVGVSRTPDPPRGESAPDRDERSGSI